MYRAELQKLEGVWTGIETISISDTPIEANTRLSFQTVFDGRFLVCDYVQTMPDKSTSVAHGVFRRDDRTNALTVTWFRSPVATKVQQSDAVAEGDKLIFNETVDGRTTRTTYAVAMDRLSIRTDSLLPNGEWKRLVEGTYRRR